MELKKLPIFSNMFDGKIVSEGKKLVDFMDKTDFFTKKVPYNEDIYLDYFSRFNVLSSDIEISYHEDTKFLEKHENFVSLLRQVLIDLGDEGLLNPFVYVRSFILLSKIVRSNQRQYLSFLTDLNKYDFLYDNYDYNRISEYLLLPQKSIIYNGPNRGKHIFSKPIIVPFVGSTGGTIPYNTYFYYIFNDMIPIGIPGSSNNLSYDNNDEVNVADFITHDLDHTITIIDAFGFDNNGEQVREDYKLVYKYIFELPILNPTLDITVVDFLMKILILMLFIIHHERNVEYLRNNETLCLQLYSQFYRLEEDNYDSEINMDYTLGIDWLIGIMERGSRYNDVVNHYSGQYIEIILPNDDIFNFQFQDITFIKNKDADYWKKIANLCNHMIDFCCSYIKSVL